MDRRITITCPKETDKEYFSYKKQTYHADISIYINNAMLFSHINDAQEYLPLEYSKEINLNESKDNLIKFEYKLSFGPEKENVDVIYNLKTNGVCETTIHRHNFVEGSQNLDEGYLVTFSINDQKTFLDKKYHEENSKIIRFDSNYSYPLDVRWFSKKPFTDTSKVYWDDIRFRIE